MCRFWAPHPQTCGLNLSLSLNNATSNDVTFCYVLRLDKVWRNKLGGGGRCCVRYLFPFCRWMSSDSCRVRRSTVLPHARSSPHSPLLTGRSCPAGLASSNQIAVRKHIFTEWFFYVRRPTWVFPVKMIVVLMNAWTFRIMWFLKIRSQQYDHSGEFHKI